MERSFLLDPVFQAEHLGQEEEVSAPDVVGGHLPVGVQPLRDQGGDGGGKVLPLTEGFNCLLLFLGLGGISLVVGILRQDKQARPKVASRPYFLAMAHLRVK